METLVVERERLNAQLKVHGTEEQLELYALGRLPEAETNALEEHLLVCDSCRQRLDGTGDFALGMRDAGAPAVNPPAGAQAASRDWSAFFRRLAVSMALALALVLLVIGILSTGRAKLAPIASLELTAVRGAMVEAAPASSYSIHLKDAPSDGGPFKVEVVNAAGETIWSGLAESGPSGTVVTLAQSLKQGDYFVRLNTADGKALREYGFRVR